MMNIELNKLILPKDNHKEELNHIFVDEEHIVSTDTRILIVTKHEEDIKKPFLITNPQAKYPGAFNFVLEGIEKNHAVNYSCANGYPNYKHILLDEKDKKEINYCFVDTLYHISTKHGIAFDFVNNATLFKRIDRLMGEMHYYIFSSTEKPVELISENAKIVIMPYIM